MLKPQVESADVEAPAERFQPFLSNPYLTFRLMADRPNPLASGYGNATR
jgi:hypothetical protein